MRRLVSLFFAVGISLTLASCVVYPGDPWCARHPHRCE